VINHQNGQAQPERTKTTKPRQKARPIILFLQYNVGHIGVLPIHFPSTQAHLDQRRQKPHGRGFVEGSKTYVFIVPCMLLPAGELGLEELEREEGEEEVARSRQNVAPQSARVVEIKGWLLLRELIIKRGQGSVCSAYTCDVVARLLLDAAPRIQSQVFSSLTLPSLNVLSG
jgi:hypothetical protein